MENSKKKKKDTNTQEENAKKRKKVTPHNSHVEEEEDRLSDLHDDILHRILSFLSIKYAVQTSVLSKRWRNLWTSLPDLNFDAKSFGSLPSFKKFVLWFLAKRDLKFAVRQFRFSPKQCVDKSFITKFINYAFSHNIQNLDLHLGYRAKDFFLRHALLTCQSWETIQLGRSSSSLRSFGFTMLTTLRLKHCSMNLGFCDIFSSTATNLKNLHLICCCFKDCMVLKISGPQVTYLTVERIYYGSESLSEGCEVEISAPKLTHFSYKRSEPVHFSLINLPSLQYVDIHLLPSFKQEHFLNSFKLLQGLYNAQSVTLSYSTIMALNMNPSMLDGQASPFRRLKFLKLKLNCYYTYDLSVVRKDLKAYLLEGSPSAEIVFER